MECYCEPQSADGGCSVWKQQWFVARKQHRCCECLETIEPGQRYERIFCVYEGEVSVYKTCEFCANEFERLSRKHNDFDCVKGDLACLLVWDMRNEMGESDVRSDLGDS